MYLQFVLAALLALSGVAGHASQAQDSSAPQQRVIHAVSGASVGIPNPPSAPADGLSLKKLAIVVPPVEPSDPVAAPGGPLETQAAAGEVVADQLVAPKRVESEVVKTVGFQTLGVTWPDTAKVGDLGGQVRTRTAGTWSRWVNLEPTDSAPDAGTADAARAVRAGTDPVSIGNADAVQLAFNASPKGGPKGMSLALIGSAEKPAPRGLAGSSSGIQTTASTTGQAAIQTVAYSTALVQAVGAPSVISRAAWGAPRQACTPDVASTLVGATLHHTADPNTYTSVAQAEQQIRNDAAYHINSLGWCDLGYNFVVDKWGNIYEGRANSLTQPVVGAHAGGFNTGTVGVAMLGTYDASPSEATQRSVAAIIGWRLGAYGADPSGSMTYTTGDGGVGVRYKNQTVLLPRVFGHRDVWFTACPGDGGYAALPNIRAMAHSFAGPLLVTFNPFGQVDAVTSPGPGKVTARGWAIDPDTSSPIIVQMYVDGRANALTWANAPRPDVGAVYPAAGPNHGYTLTMTTTPGLHTVCLFAINAGPGTSGPLGCRAVNVATSNPFGAIDAVSSAGSGKVTARGWAIDPDTSSPIKVQMYVDYRANAVALADQPRPDVGAVYPPAGPSHGYTLTMQSTPGAHTVCLYAINTGLGISRQIGCRAVNLS